jgi:hypothetical protein
MSAPEAFVQVNATKLAIIAVLAIAYLLFKFHK